MTRKYPTPEIPEGHVLPLARMVAQTSWLPDPETVQAFGRAVFPVLRARAGKPRLSLHLENGESLFDMKEAYRNFYRNTKEAMRDTAKKYMANAPQTSNKDNPVNTPPADSSEAARQALKAAGYPKTDQDPATGETFKTYPERLFYDENHPIYGQLPDNSRPENWRELDSAFFNPSKARDANPPAAPSIRPGLPPDRADNSARR